MAETLTLAVEPRDPKKNQGTGSRVARRLRKQGRIPAIIYGHKETPVPISLSRDDVLLMLKKAAHVAQLTLGGRPEMVLVRDVQWDHLGKEVLHLDFARVSADEKVHTQVPLEVHGTPVGLSEGGQLEVIVHSLDVTCLATAIPDSIRVEVGGLHVGEGVHVKELALPEGVTVDLDADLLLVHVVTRVAAPEPTAGEGGPAEPEVIGRKAEKDEEEK
jgi:large subunit ribosomal protein L25